MGPRESEALATIRSSDQVTLHGIPKPSSGFYLNCFAEVGPRVPKLSYLVIIITGSATITWALV